MHSAELSFTTASTAARQLAAYFQRFRTQLAASNARNVQTLIRVAEALAGVAGIDEETTGKGPSATARTVNDFLFSTGLDNVNMFQLIRHLKESKAIFKVAGYWQAAQRRAETSEPRQEIVCQYSNGHDEGATGALHSLVSFLKALTNNDADGRVIVDSSNGCIKFVLLNAAVHFSRVVADARAVILASGTLSPLDSVLNLFPTVPRNAIYHYSCGHVVGAERLLAVAIGAGPSGGVLDFRHGSRASNGIIDELGRLVINVCAIVRGGVVVFFSSFAYADQVYVRWSTSGVLKALEQRKKVFREPRSASEVEQTLAEYATAVSSSDESNNGTGAVIFSVVGGKLAEGINFGDALGRCVIVVGLPYPNPSDPELQERLRYIDHCSGQNGQSASREHYSNLCMKAVNQCIGRAIRHRRDYAAVMLADARYASAVDDEGRFNGPLAKLPQWIQESLVVAKEFGEAYGKMAKFYKSMMHGVDRAIIK